MGILKKLAKLSPSAMLISKMTGKPQSSFSLGAALTKGKKPQPMPAKRPAPQDSEGMVTAKKGGSMKKPAGKSAGSFRTSANGIATKGKTKAKQVKMAKGGGMC